MLTDGKIAARIPVQDLQRARVFYAEKLGEGSNPPHNLSPW